MDYYVYYHMRFDVSFGTQFGVPNIIFKKKKLAKKNYNIKDTNSCTKFYVAVDVVIHVI